MLSTLLNRPCTIWSRSASGDLDELGDAIDNETATQTVCELQQRQRTEPRSESDLSDTGWLLILPAGTAVDTSDRVEVDGHVFEVIGDPWVARNPQTQTVSHIEATLRRTAGAENAS